MLSYGYDVSKSLFPLGGDVMVKKIFLKEHLLSFGSYCVISNLEIADFACCQLHSARIDWYCKNALLFFSFKISSFKTTIFCLKFDIFA